MYVIFYSIYVIISTYIEYSRSYTNLSTDVDRSLLDNHSPGLADSGVQDNVKHSVMSQADAAVIE